MVLLLDNIRSLYNVGSIFRSADGFGIEKIYICGYTGCPPRKEISKTALGAEDVVEWEHSQDIRELIEILKNDGFNIVSLEKSKDSTDIRQYHWDKKTALILGNEIEGISENILSISDAVLHINMIGIKESFNVASAASIAMYAESMITGLKEGKKL